MTVIDTAAAGPSEPAARASRRRIWTLLACRRTDRRARALGRGSAAVGRERVPQPARGFSSQRVEHHGDARDVATPGRRFRHDCRLGPDDGATAERQPIQHLVRDAPGTRAAGRKPRHRGGRTDPGRPPRSVPVAARPRPGIQVARRRRRAHPPERPRVVLPAGGRRSDRLARFGYVAPGPGGLVQRRARRSARPRPRSPAKRRTRDSFWRSQRPLSASRRCCSRPRSTASARRFETCRERRAASAGWIVSTFDVQGLITAAINGTPGVDVALYHRNPGQRWASVGVAGSTPSGHLLTYASNLSIDGQWRVVVRGVHTPKGMSHDIRQPDAVRRRSDRQHPAVRAGAGAWPLSRQSARNGPA